MMNEMAINDPAGTNEKEPVMDSGNMGQVDFTFDDQHEYNLPLMRLLPAEQLFNVRPPKNNLPTAVSSCSEDSSVKSDLDLDQSEDELSSQSGNGDQNINFGL